MEKSIIVPQYSNQEIITRIGITLRNYRRALGRSQMSIALETGLSLPTIGRVESGLAPGVSINSLIKIFRAVGKVEEIYKILE